MLEITNDRPIKNLSLLVTAKFIVLSDTFCKVLRDFVFFFVSRKFAKRTARYSEFGSNREF